MWKMEPWKPFIYIMILLIVDIYNWIGSQILLNCCGVTVTNLRL
jgi:hypothetical protein